MKSKKYLPLILLLILLLSFVFYFVFIKNRANVKPLNDQSSQENGTEFSDTLDSGDSNLTPEEVIKRLEEQETVKIEEPISIEIISPEGEDFLQGQARFYKAEISNFPENAMGKCYWKFYLNEYEEEVLYEEMTTGVSPGSSNMDQASCGFTSSFIENKGELRIEVLAQLTSRSSDEVLAEAVSERTYLVH